MKADEPRTGIGYIRVSEATADMHSPEQQKYLIERRAEQYGIRIIGFVEDIDRSGRTLAKRQIMAVIGRIRQGEADVVLAWKLSRIGRNVVETVKIVNEIEKTGAQFVSATEEIDTSTSQGRWMLHQIASMDQFYSDNIGDSWKETIDRSIREGKTANGRARFGYKRCNQCVPKPPKVVDGKELAVGYFPCKACDGIPEIHPVNGPALAEAYQMYIDGQGFNKIAQTMTDRGVRSNWGNAMDYTYWRKVMDTGFAAGLICGKSKKFQTGTQAIAWDLWAEGVHPRLIDRKLWEQYVARRERNYTKTGRALTPMHALSSLVRCGAVLPSGEVCMASMVARWTVSSDVKYYSCIARSNLRTCSGTSVRMDALHDFIKGWITAEAKAPDDTADRAMQAAARKRDLSSELSIAQAEETRLKQRKQRNSAGWSSGVLDDEDYRNNREEIDAELAITQARIKMLGGALNADPPEPAEFRGILALWDDPDVIGADLNRLLCQVIGHVTVTSRKWSKTFEAKVTPLWESESPPVPAGRLSSTATRTRGGQQPPKRSSTPGPE